MKRKIIAIAGLLVSVNVIAQQNCTVKVKVADMPSSGKVYLTIAGNTDSAVIEENGIATFNEHIDKPVTAKLMLRKFSGGMISSNESKYIYALPGMIEVTVTDKDSIFKATVKGPALTTAYDEQLRLPVDRYNLQTHLLDVAYRTAKKEQRADTTELLYKKEENIKACFNVPQVYIKANPNSSLSIVALNFLGNGEKSNPVHIDDLEGLYKSLTDEVKNSEDGLKYAEKLKKLKERNK